MKRLVVLLLVLPSIAWAQKQFPPSLVSISGRISVIADTTSPYWKSLINTYIPRGVNKIARYPIIAGSIDAPYKLVVKVVNADTYISGISGNEHHANVKYRTRVEVEVNFLDMNNKIVWTWSGWADYSSANRSMSKIAKMLGQDMSKDGLLEPSYYTSTKQ